MQFSIKFAIKNIIISVVGIHGNNRHTLFAKRYTNVYNENKNPGHIIARK